MNHKIPLFLVGAVLCCTQAPAQKLEFKEHLTKEFKVTQNQQPNTLAIYNINGSIKVEGYDGDKVLLEVDKRISAKTNEILEEGKQKFKLEFEQKADSIIAYISEPFDSRPNHGKKNWNGPKIEYHFELDFMVKVPNSMNLAVSTVNGGDVTVSNVTGSLNVHNVNGAIRMTNAKGVAKVGTINGNVEANFLTFPNEASEFKTLNGDIKITYPSALSADCLFKSFNGEFYTDFSNFETLPSKVEKNAEKHDSKTTYKLNAQTRIRIGKGGPTYNFETFNGNIYIKKQS